ncbi:MAG: GNAT family N-acetyltransferase [Hyphomicrobiaceae bacterium]|nr:GNAT family N-acetyltransferase [Hyphomicrobiaceae bacterium]
MRRIEVRLATVDDAEIVGRLIDAMDAHYNGAGKTAGIAGAVAMARDAMAAREGTKFLVAETEGKPVGLACYVVIRPGRRHQGLVFLKDLFVVSDVRSLGVGRALMSWLARFAIAEGIGRIDLTTDHANTRAQALYTSLGGVRREMLLYRFDGATLWSLAGSRDPGPDAG